MWIGLDVVAHGKIVRRKIDSQLFFIDNAHLFSGEEIRDDRYEVLTKEEVEECMVVAHDTKDLEKYPFIVVPKKVLRRGGA